MNQITITVDLTPKNLELIKAFCNEQPSQAAPVVKEISAPVPPESPFPDMPSVKEEVKTYSKTDVKAVCLKLSKEGKQDALKAAFAKFNAKKLTEVPEADYPALMEELSHA